MGFGAPGGGLAESEQEAGAKRVFLASGPFEWDQVCF